MDLSTKRQEHEEKLKEIRSVSRRKKRIATLIWLVYAIVSTFILTLIFPPLTKYPMLIFCSILNIPGSLVVLFRFQKEFTAQEQAQTAELIEKAPMGRLRF